MGKLILCSSVIAKNPYCFPMTKTKVYSIEEVCYYIRNNIYMMQEEVFDLGVCGLDPRGAWHGGDRR